MWGPWWGGPGWVAGLIGGAFWLLVIVLAIVFLRRELPHLQLHHHHASPALRLLEERYAKGEITREEFLSRRDVLLGATLESPRPVPPSTGTPPGDPHVRVTAAPPPVQPRPAPPPPEDAEAPTPPPPPAPRPSEEPVPGPGAADKPPGGRTRRRKPSDPTEPVPPVPPPGS